MSEFTQLLKGKSMMRYFPAKGTAGFARLCVRTPRRVPSPPARIIARTLISDNPLFCIFLNFRRAEKKAPRLGGFFKPISFPADFQVNIHRAMVGAGAVSALYNMR